MNFSSYSKRSEAMQVTIEVSDEVVLQANRTGFSV
jgi:hypothetical protein